MAKNKSVVLLGYEDEVVTEKHKQFIDFTTNKIGGDANWPSGDIKIPCCPICNLQRPLIAQIYAPLDSSAFHRTIYVFACLNGPCSTSSQAWVCVRAQLLEKFNETAAMVATQPISQAATIWCSGADDWGDDDDGGVEENAAVNDVDNNNCGEENGNVIKCDNSKMSDEDDESNSLENETTLGFENLVMEDNNANCGAQGGMVNNRISVLNASAEIDGEESELVTVDTPVRPQRDLISLMAASQTISAKDKNNLTLKSFFVAVDEERSLNGAGAISEHVRDLLQEYQSRDDVKSSPDTPTGGAAMVIGNIDQETYEKGIPVHGDVMFHGFLTKLQENPGQIIRYSRNSMPLLIAPIKEPLPKCGNCGGDTICELQILPTLIPRLRLAASDSPAPLEFGNCLIFTCLQNCWDTPDKMRVESVIIQQEF